MLSNAESLAQPVSPSSGVSAPVESTDVERYLGATVAGRYRLETLIAEGGMGLVFRARHSILDQPIALKLVRPAFAHDPVAVARFLDEARVIARVKSPHVARVFDSGTSEDGTPYMALELLTGWDLRSLLQRDGPMSCEQAAAYVAEACHAISETHGLGVIHRDLKPENLFLHHADNGARIIKVLDFGISKYLNSELQSGGRSHTTVGETVGSPHYMSPEQMAAHSVDARTDIWALGVVLFELVTGQVPFPGDSIGQVCATLFAEEAPALSSIRPSIPAPFERIVRRCLSKNAVERYWHADELAQALRAFLNGEAQDESPAQSECPTLVSVAAPQAEPSRTARVSVRQPLRSGWLYLALLGLLAGSVGVSRSLKLNVQGAAAAADVVAETPPPQKAEAPASFAPIQVEAAAEAAPAKQRAVGPAENTTIQAAISSKPPGARPSPAAPVARTSWSSSRTSAPSPGAVDELIAPYPPSSESRAESHDKR